MESNTIHKSPIIPFQRVISMIIYYSERIYQDLHPLNMPKSFFLSFIV